MLYAQYFEPPLFGRHIKLFAARTNLIPSKEKKESESPSSSPSSS